MYRFVTHFFQRRTIIVPTLLGAVCLTALAGIPLLAWLLAGESVLSTTARVPADILILEAWTKEDGAQAASAEFKQFAGQYKRIVVAGGLTGEKWTRRRWSEPEIAQRELRRSGVPAELIISVQVPDVDAHRTFATAVAARSALERRGIRCDAVNVLTRGAHARRSRLVFARVFGPGTKVGVIGWQPPGFESPSWWRSSQRSEEFLKETVAYVYEAVFWSGRIFDTPAGINAVPPIAAAQSRR